MNESTSQTYMSDLQALYAFLNRPVSADMVALLVATTESVISVPRTHQNDAYLTPPASPTGAQQSVPVPSLTHFIQRLIEHSHVQTATLMTSLVYLNRLRAVMAPGAQGMETTHHRIFLGSLILAAKFTNDSSPLNRHWSKYTDGLLDITQVNALERELIEYIGWDNINFSNKDLILSLQHFLRPIKQQLRAKAAQAVQQRYAPLESDYITFQQQQQEPQTVEASPSMPSLLSASSSTSTIGSMSSSRSSTRDLNIQLKPLRLPSGLKNSKSSLKLSQPLQDISNNQSVLSTY